MRFKRGSSTDPVEPLAVLVCDVIADEDRFAATEGLDTHEQVDGARPGIALGFFIGKQIGVMVPLYALVYFRLAPLPAGSSWRHVYAMSCCAALDSR